MMYKVVEHFISINGEGKKAGELALFIRFAGCNLNCSYCDTKWANEETVIYEWFDLERIYQLIQSSGIKNITLTGGEPLIQEGMKELLSFLSEDDSLSIEIETNGSVDLSTFREIANQNVTFTLDYKLACSQMEERMFMLNFQRLTKKDVVKFVIGDVCELEKVYQLIQQYSLIQQCTVFLSPVYGKVDPEQIVCFMKRNQLNGVKLQIQLHKIIWNPEERGV